jgi:hypothetical protein
MTRAGKTHRSGVEVDCQALPEVTGEQRCGIVALVGGAPDEIGRFGEWLRAPRSYSDEGV